MRFLFAAGFLLFSTVSSAQYARFLFRNPLGIPMHLIANFGEIRNDHYHMGLDLRTQQSENLPVYAAAEGYISRVTIEAGGYGKCIYITHPNGYTSLYAHLNSFFPALQAFVEHRQYHDEQWEQDIRFPRSQFVVAKGQYIARSGSTGAVEGPHLHFEVRNTKTGNNINPLFLGFPVKDVLPPFIYKLYLYDRNYSTYAQDPTEIALRSMKNIYTTKDSVIRTGSNKISFGISAEDIANGSGFRFGIYGADLWMDADSGAQFRFQLREFNYEESRYVNASIDYRKWIKDKTRIQHLSRLPGNHLFLKEWENDGVISLQDTLVHDLEVFVTDAAANEAVLKFKLQWAPELYQERMFTQETVKFIPGKKNTYSSDSITVTLPPAALYDTIHFFHAQLPAAENGLPVHQLHYPDVPLHDPYTVSIMKEGLPDPAKIILRLTSGKYTESVKPTYRDGVFTASFDRFGILEMIEDTVPPVISPMGWSDSAVFSGNNAIRFVIKDDYGPVKKMRAEIDGLWLMFERKGNTYTYKFDGYCSPGQHRLSVTAEDIAGNKVTGTYNFELKQRPAAKKKTAGKSAIK